MYKNNSWNRLQNQDQNQIGNYRNVYEDQQFDRSGMEKKQSSLSRTIFTLVLSLVMASAAWIGIGAVRFAMSAMIGGQDAPVQVEGYEPGNSDLYTRRELDYSMDQGIYAYYAIDENGNPYGEKYERPEDVPVPQWYLDKKAQYDALLAEYNQTHEAVPVTLADYLAFASCNWMNLVGALGAALFTGCSLYPVMMRNLAAQNQLRDYADINQYKNDQHIQLPEEIMDKFEYFADAGAHCSPSVSTLISHAALSNKGIKEVEISRRAKKDEFDEDGDVLYLKGEILEDENGDYIKDRKPLFDTKFMNELFEVSRVPNGKNYRQYFNPSRISYNKDGKKKNKLAGYKTVADMINADWEFPDYETQRPGGAYLVDTDPVNTMLIAITRAGKGQSYIIPYIDCLTRSKSISNIIVNDPKGELLKMFYVPGTYRGYQLVQFNLINPMNTDIYNPLLMAANAAREGDFTKVAAYVENIAEVFFPINGAEDPVWPKSAANAFKRSAYGLIDYYMEEEKELRRKAARTGMDSKTLETKLDHLWGQVTLYNVYQMFVQLTSRLELNPLMKFKADYEEFKNNPSHPFSMLSEEELIEKREAAEEDSVFWRSSRETDLLTLYFNASSMLPRSSMRNLVSNADDSLRAMGGAEKMKASVFAIAITAMSFFSDPTISTLTSGTPSQNVDLAGLSFPRRIGFRLHADFIRRYHLKGMKVIWQAYSDCTFENSLGEDFYHEDIINMAGWSHFYFKGIFPEKSAYLKCEIQDLATNQKIFSFFFRFTKNYQVSLNGRSYFKDPVLNEKIIRDGFLTELRPRKDQKTGKTIYKPGHLKFKSKRMTGLDSQNPHVETVTVDAIVSHMARYSEKPKMVFVVTPPNLTTYAKLILILLKQLVDLNFEQSYIKKADQKPLYPTRFILDELGNLQSDGHGISGLETMMSIGLGQDQYFSLVVQTLAQLKDVYGDADKIIQGNVANIAFLKSSDEEMMQTLEKMSGTQHRTYTSSKVVTQDTSRVWMRTEGNVAYTMSTVEEPVIKYNDLAFLPERQSIVFRTGDSPIWNRNQMTMPVAWKLYENPIPHPGHEYTFMTIPTLSSAKEFDVARNIPDFAKMLEKRKRQAKLIVQAREIYQQTFGYTDYEMSQLDPDILSDDLMEMVDLWMEKEDQNESETEHLVKSEPEYRKNTELAEETDRLVRQAQEYQKPIFAGNTISRFDLLPNNRPNHSFDTEIIDSFRECRTAMINDRFFCEKDGNLYSANGITPYIVRTSREELDKLNKAAKDRKSRVFADEDLTEGIGALGMSVTDDFIRWLATMPAWRFAGGRFEQEMAKRLKARMSL